MSNTPEDLPLAQVSAEDLRDLGVVSGRSNLDDIEERMFTEQRLLFYGIGVAALWSIILTWLIFQVGWIIRPTGELTSLDFCWIWISGKFASSGDPGRIYEHLALLVNHDNYFRPGECSMPPLFDYPPTSLFVTYFLGLMPYPLAFAAWVVATLLLYLAAVYAIISRPAALIAALTPVAVVANVLLGHNGFLTAGLMGLSLAFMKRRPWLSGFFLGFLTYKPQFGILFPLALLASRNWRALGSATVTSVILAVAAASAFGYRGWPAFFESLFARNSGLSLDGGELRHQSIFGLLHWANASPWISWTVQLAFAVVIAGTVYAVWAKPIPHALKAAVLCIGSVTVTPYVLPYDLCILSIAVAFLVVDGLARGFLPGERTAMLICWAGTFLMLTHTGPIGPAIDAVLLCLAVRRIVAYRGDHGTALRDAPLRRTAFVGGS